MEPILVIPQTPRGRVSKWGTADPETDTIEISPNLLPKNKRSGIKHLRYLLHERLHLLDPDMSERKVRAWAMRLARVAWDEGYRLTPPLLVK